MKRLLFIVLILKGIISYSQSVPSSFIQDLTYRMIGPFRAGRTVGAVGIPQKPNVFYIGVNNGGVWKTDDYGRTWRPLFDKESTGSIGDLAVSASNPEILYVGTGEGLHRPDLSIGDGIFKTTDGGKNWTHLGLNDVQQVGRIIVHPKNPDIVFVAALGHPYGANEQRGIFRSKDGGLTWQKVLYIDQNTGAIQVEFDPTNPSIVYADLWEHRDGPWENASWSGKNSGLFKSTDGGTTWKKLTKGLPTSEDGLGRIGFCIAPSNTKILYATVDAQTKGGIYMSKDAGESWSLLNPDSRLWGRGGDFAEIKAHPQNANKIYIANVAAYVSEDGGKHFVSFKGAPGGDDYHRIWINPSFPDIMLFAADQGATITVNGGRTWSSWHNQPTAQLYHVSTDDQFPYHIYGGQQESGALGIASRGKGGQITSRDWIGVGSDEYAYVAPDPLNSDIIYGGRVTRYDRKTGTSQYVGPEALRTGKYRILRTMPLLFHPADPHNLLFASNVLWSTKDGGTHWDIISPDLSRSKTEVPSSIGDFKNVSMDNMPRRGVIYSVAGSPLQAQVIWAGTDDGLIHVTRDGGQHWKDITPPPLTSWDKISQIDAGHFNVATAYVSINSLRKDDLKPYLFKTTDFGVSWTLLSKGIPDKNPINVIREDPKQPGLLFAGTETQVFYSIDDGAHWQTLRLNMPATSIRDLVIKNDDLIIGTHGRSIWVLDNIQPLREAALAIQYAGSYLYQSPTAFRIRNNILHETPLPPEEPAGQNPPDGAIIDYYLPTNINDLTITITDAKNNIIRTYSSEAPLETIDFNSLAYPDYWLLPLQKPSTRAGHHRIVWDLRYSPPEGTDRELTIGAVYKNTNTSPVGPYVHPGLYKIILQHGSSRMEKNIRVELDPRVTLSNKDLEAQTEASMLCYNYYQEAQQLRQELEKRITSESNAESKNKWIQLRGQGQPGAPDHMYSSITELSADKETIVGIQYKWLFLLNLLQTADAAPTEAVTTGIERLKKVWMEMKKRI